MVDSGAPTPTKEEKEKGARSGEEDDVGTCTDIGDCMDDNAMGGSGDEDGFNELTDSQDIRSFM